MDLKEFQRNLEVKVLEKNPLDATIRIKGIEAPMANALRRIIMSEIQTMAIDKVVMYQNTSVMQDEILVHRLGLVPIKINPDFFQNKKKNENFSQENCLKFYLNVKCTRKPEFKNKSEEELKLLKRRDYLDNTDVFASAMKWEPIGNQQQTLQERPKVLYEEILLVQLEENQEVEFEVYLTKNNGETHTKWSPVSTVYYKLQNHIKIEKEITGEEAQRMKTLCPMNVFEVKSNSLRVKNVDDCTFCRECIGDEKQGENIVLAKEQENYIFTIESVGCLEPVDLMKRALKQLIQKSRYYGESVQRLNN